MLALGMEPWPGPAGVQCSWGTAYPQKGPGLLLPFAVAILKFLIMDHVQMVAVRKMVPRGPQGDPKGPEHQGIRHTGAGRPWGLKSGGDR